MCALRWAPLGALLGVALAGCTAPGAMSHTALDFNETVARASDSQILLNIVRATYRNPTHYSAITQVRDSRNIQGTASIGGTFPFGPDATHAYPLTPGLSATGTLQPSFDVAPLDTRSAATGLLHPIDAQIPMTYWQQNWPRMVLLFLFVDDVTLNEPAKKACGLTDIRGTFIDNAAYNVRQFDLARRLFECLAPALQLVSDKKTTNYMTETPISPDVVLKSLPDLDKNDFDVTEKAKGVFTISKTTKKAKFFLRFRGAQGVVVDSKFAVKNETKQPAISMDIRSVDGMVYYLGELIRLQEQERRLMTFDTGFGPEALINVRLDPDADPDTNITADFLGNRYAVSRYPARNDRSLTVLALLSQLFSLYREEKDLPKTSAVEVVGAR